MLPPGRKKGSAPSKIIPDTPCARKFPLPQSRGGSSYQFVIRAITMVMTANRMAKTTVTRASSASMPRALLEKTVSAPPPIQPMPADLASCPRIDAIRMMQTIASSIIKMVSKRLAPLKMRNKLLLYHTIQCVPSAIKMAETLYIKVSAIFRFYCCAFAAASSASSPVPTELSSPENRSKSRSSGVREECHYSTC